MTVTQGNNIKMNEGDFGVELPITIGNTLDSDTIKFIIYDASNNEIVNKTLPYRNEAFIFELTKEESGRLVKKNYLYKMVQYRNNIMQNTLNEGSIFEII